MTVEPPEHGDQNTPLDWLAGLLALSLLGINVYVALWTGDVRFLVVAGGFAVGLLLFVTGLWRPVLYLLGALYAGVLGVVWLLSGQRYPSLGTATGVVSVAFVGVVLYLFLQESALFR